MAKFNRNDQDDDEAAIYNGPLTLASKPVEVKRPNETWKTQIVSCGSNAFGQSYFQDIMSTTFKALRFESNEYIEDIVCGSTITAAKSKDGNVYLWGSGLPSGQMKVPTLIPLQKVSKISLGSSHIGAITQDGRVHTWGSAENGMLGHGNKVAVNDLTQPIEMPS